MDTLYNYYISKLTLSDTQDKNKFEIYIQCYNAIWNEIDLFFGNNYPTDLPELKRNITEWAYRNELEDLFANFILFMQERTFNHQNTSELSLDDVRESVNEFTSIIKTIFSLASKRITYIDNAAGLIKSDVDSYLRFRNKTNLDHLNEIIKSKLYEKSILGKVKLENMPLKLFKNIMLEIFQQFLVEQISHCLSAERICEKVNSVYSFDWKRTTFERYCTKNKINWKKLAERNSLKVCKEKVKRKIKEVD